jgi:diguanylate cyclase (GGDEF)-like protein
MNTLPFELVAAALALIPIVGLWVAHPRRVTAALAVAIVSGVAAALFLLAAPTPQQPLAALSAIWAVLGSLCSYWACRRRADQFSRHAAALAATRETVAKTQKQLTEVKARGAQMEREQRETLALYGMIKSLAEALSWNDMRPKLEAAVDQFLGASSYALYAVSTRERSGFQALTCKRLEGSPGSSWSTLERFLQERGLRAGQAQAFAQPEAAIGVPVLDGEGVVGYFYARLPQGAKAEAFLAKAQAFVQEVAFAFRRVKLFQEVEALSQTDGLTGLYRRGDFDERLAREVTRAQTFKTTFGLMLLDIDHFKQLNDRYGHQFGDQVLKRVGEILGASVYDTDFVARYGGEEFVVVAPRAEPAGALRKAEAIRQAVEAERFPRGFETVRVTVSIGVAHFPRDAQNAEELIGRADAAMYTAKSQGRNRVVDCETLRKGS